MRTRTSPAFTAWLSLTSTSSTLPGILGATAIMCASTWASSLDTRSRKWNHAHAPIPNASTSIPRAMNLTGDRRGVSSAGGSAETGLSGFDNSSITSGILNYHLPVLNQGMPGARLFNRLIQLDFRVQPAEDSTPCCRYFGTTPPPSGRGQA